MRMKRKLLMIIICICLNFLFGCTQVTYSLKEPSNYVSKEPIKLEGLTFEIVSEESRISEIKDFNKYNEILLTIKVTNNNDFEQGYYLGVAYALDITTEERYSFGYGGSQFEAKSFGTSFLKPDESKLETAEITYPIDIKLSQNSLTLNNIEIKEKKTPPKDPQKNN